MQSWGTMVTFCGRPARKAFLALRLFTTGPATEPGLERLPGGTIMTDTIDRPSADGEHVLDHLIIRFAGDSGDGMQLTGDRFTSVSASFGNDLSTLPDFPAEIRAPAGTVNGVSAFQVNIADHKITTPATNRTCSSR
jgi:hypothetical protein